MRRKGATALQNDKTGKKTADSQQSGGVCESCEFYDYDGDEDAYVCCVALDQDAMADFLAGQTGRCPYYRFYDEYKSVHKQI